MTRANGLAALFVAIALAAPAAADGTAPSANEPVSPIETLPDDRDLVLACETNTLWLDSEPFGSSGGRVDLRLRFTGEDGAVRVGTWSVVAVSDAHKHSFARRTQATCENGCVMRLAVADTAGEPKEPRRQLELWAPNPAGIDRLGDDEELTLATFKLPSLDLKASMFRGRTPLGFEQGTCAVRPDGAKPDETSGTPPDNATSTEQPTPPAENEANAK